MSTAFCNKKGKTKHQQGLGGEFFTMKMTTCHKLGNVLDIWY